MNVQHVKGSMELCALSMLSKADMYGYELAAALAESLKAAEGSVYPLLKRLKDEGLVSSYIKESNTGPARKYYSLTEDGLQKKAFLLNEWKEFAEMMNNVLEKYN